MMFQRYIDETKEMPRIKITTNFDMFAECYYGEVLVDGQSWHRTGYVDTEEDAGELAQEWAEFDDVASQLLAQKGKDK